MTASMGDAWGGTPSAIARCAFASHNSYQAPPGQERGSPPNRAAKQRGLRRMSGSSRL
jgi:hypothetical protein